MSSCASLTGLEEGKTLGEGNSEMGVSLNFTSVPDLFDDEEIFDTTSVNATFPNIEVNYKYGITDKLDVGGKLSTNFNASAYAKYQVVGDESSTFALSPGLEVGSVAGLAYNVSVPIYASIYPTQNFAINLAPRFMYQFITGDTSEGLTYLGGNVGLLFGSKHKFGLDFGYYKISQDGSPNLLTIGLGGKFRFGDY